MSYIRSCRPVSGGSSRWSSPPCDCCCKGHKGEGEGESGTSFNELSTSTSESQSEASSPQGTVIRGPVTRQSHVQTLDRPSKKERPGSHLLQQQQSEQRRKSDLLRTLTASSRDTSGSKKRPAKEKMSVEEELEKCIQDFRKIKIPEHFPERKYMWQSDLLRKYRLWGTAETSRNVDQTRSVKLWVVLMHKFFTTASDPRVFCVTDDSTPDLFNTRLSVAQKDFVRKAQSVDFFFFFVQQNHVCFWPYNVTGHVQVVQRSGAERASQIINNSYCLCRVLAKNNHCIVEHEVLFQHFENWTIPSIGFSGPPLPSDPLPLITPPHQFSHGIKGVARRQGGNSTPPPSKCSETADWASSIQTWDFRSRMWDFLY